MSTDMFTRRNKKIITFWLKKKSALYRAMENTTCYFVSVKVPLKIVEDHIVVYFFLMIIIFQRNLGLICEKLV